MSLFIVIILRHERKIYYSINLLHYYCIINLSQYFIVELVLCHQTSKILIQISNSLFGMKSWIGILVTLMAL